MLSPKNNILRLHQHKTNKLYAWFFFFFFWGGGGGESCISGLISLGCTSQVFKNTRINYRHKQDQPQLHLSRLPIWGICLSRKKHLCLDLCWFCLSVEPLTETSLNFLIRNQNYPSIIYLVKESLTHEKHKLWMMRPRCLLGNQKNNIVICDRINIIKW